MAIFRFLLAVISLWLAPLITRMSAKTKIRNREGLGLAISKSQQSVVVQISENYTYVAK